MEWLVTGYMILHPTMVVEAETEEEAIDKAWVGDTVGSVYEDAHLDSGKLCHKNRWSAKQYL